MNALITIIIIVCAGIYILVLLRRRMPAHPYFTLQNIFEKFVVENKLLIHYKDVLDKRLIGFDKKSKKLLLLNINKADKITTCLNIDEIDSCNMVVLNDDASKQPRKVLLELATKEKNKPVRFCFFDASYDDERERTCLLLKANKWNERINFHTQYWWVN